MLRTWALPSAIVIALSLTSACTKSSSPTSPSPTASAVVTTYSGLATFVLNGSRQVGKLELTASVASAVAQLVIGPQAATTTGSGTVTGTFISPSGTVALSGTISSGILTVQGNGLAFTATTSSDGALTGTGTGSNGQAFAVVAYVATATSGPATFAGTFDSNYSGKNADGQFVFEHQVGPMQFTISGTPYATNRYSVSGFAVDQSPASDRPGSPDVIPFAGTVVMGTGDTPRNIQTGANFLDVHTIGGGSNQINIAASYVGGGLWRGVFSGSDGQGTTNGSFSATPY